MNGVIYARYSSDNQREESIEGQIRECMEFAERQGITVIGNYIDRALSAKTDDRPDFQRMIKDSTKQLFDVVIVWKLDRFSRNRYDSAYYKMLLKKSGVKVISAKENISDRPEGILLESMLEGYAEFYSAELSAADWELLPHIMPANSSPLIFSFRKRNFATSCNLLICSCKMFCADA